MLFSMLGHNKKDLTGCVLILYLPIPRTVSHVYNQSVEFCDTSQMDPDTQLLVLLELMGPRPGLQPLVPDESPGFLSINWDAKRILTLRLDRSRPMAPPNQSSWTFPLLVPAVPYPPIDGKWLTWAPGIEEQDEVAQHVAGALVASRGLQAEAVLADRGIGWGAELQRKDVVLLVQH